MLTLAMSHAITDGLCATRSIENTLFFTLFARHALPEI